MPRKDTLHNFEVSNREREPSVTDFIMAPLLYESEGLMAG